MRRGIKLHRTMPDTVRVPVGPLWSYVERHLGWSPATPTEVASWLDIDPSRVQVWAKRGNMELATADRIAAHLGEIPTYIWGDEFYGGTALDGPPVDPTEHRLEWEWDADGARWATCTGCAWRVPAPGKGKRRFEVDHERHHGGAS